MNNKRIVLEIPEVAANKLTQIAQKRGLKRTPFIRTMLFNRIEEEDRAERQALLRQAEAITTVNQ